ncbi:MAG: substrate-binding domain-containing protein [Desulfatibacillaceae bacterium]|nr:substrate-binding domain-containing protein [Desulfatibacillaceae bacterium]
MRTLAAILVCAAILLSAPCAWAQSQVLVMSTTTSTEASGLLGVLLPELEKDTGIKVKVIAKGTGAALKDGMDGNVDVVFVHAKAREHEFVEQGYGTMRFAVMHNDFVIVGPPSDPAKIAGSKNAADALKKIAASAAPFISRGDDSGTHIMELDLWKSTGLPLASKVTSTTQAGQQVEKVSITPADSAKWYFSIGQGMGKTLLFADEKKGYALTDRGTYIKYKYGSDAPVDLEILCEDDPVLHNIYGVIPVNPAKHPHVKHDLAMQFCQWLVSPRGQALIGGYQLVGKQLFFPDAITVQTP